VPRHVAAPADVDLARLLPHLRPGATPDSPVIARQRLELAQAAALAGALAEAPEHARFPAAAVAEPGTLRGIPVTGPHVGGAMRGTRPDLVVE
jgi:hypothetical protein